MTKLEGKTLIGDKLLVYFHEERQLIVIITLHVDDFQGGRTENFINNMFRMLSKIFKVSKREIRKFRFTGVDVDDSKEGGIMISQ